MGIACDVVTNSSAPALGELTVVGSCQNTVGRVGGEIPRGQQNRYIRALGGSRWCKQQQHLILTFEERLDLSDEELMVRRRLKALMACPFGQAVPYQSSFEEFGCCTRGISVLVHSPWPSYTRPDGRPYPRTRGRSRAGAPCPLDKTL